MPPYMFIFIITLTIGIDIVTLSFRKKNHRDKNPAINKLYRAASILFCCSIIILSNNNNNLITVIVYSIIALMLILIAYNEFKYRKGSK